MSNGKSRAARIAGAFCLALLSLSPATAQKSLSATVQNNLEKMKSTAPGVRADAADALGQMGSSASPAVPALIAALGDKSKDVRSTVADALGSIGMPASPAVPALLAALGDKVGDVRSSAANALGQIGAVRPGVVHALIAAFKDNDSNVRSSAADALGSLGTPASEAVPRLVELLNDEESDVRSNAADALGKMGTDAKTAAPALIAALNDNAHDVRASAADALGQIGAARPVVVHALIAALKDNDSNVRSTAADSLGQMGTNAKSAVPALIVALNDRDESVRNTVAEVLGNLGTDAKAAVPALIAALDDPSINVSYSAVIALGKMRTEAASAVPTLRKKLANVDTRVRRAAADVLGNLGTYAKEAVPELIGALRDDDTDFRANAADALRKIGTAPLSAVPALIAALNDKDAYARASAISVLGSMGAAATPAVPTLRGKLADANPGVRRSTAEALGNIGTAAVSTVPQLIAALNDPASDVRRAAVVALGKIGTNDKSAVGALDTVLKDKDAAARNSAAYVLGRMGTVAVRTVPDLITALTDSDTTVRASSVIALREICVSSQGSAPQLSTTQLQALLDEMEQVKQALSELTADNTLDAAYAQDTQDSLRQAAQTFLAELHSPARARDTQAARLSPVGIGIAVWLSVVVLCNVLLLAFWPLTLLRINDGMKRYGGLRRQGKVVDFSLPLRLAMGVGFLHYLPRVLDAWVRKYADTARIQLLNRPTFKEREVYVDMPVLWQGESRCLTAADIQPLFAHSSAGLLLWGEGGSGKTTLVCQMALWALEANPFKRLCATHQMLPVFIEENLPATDLQGSAALLTALQTRLQQITGEARPPSEDLVRSLLQKRRLLQIVDGISEMDAATRSLFLTPNAALPLNALLVTSRAHEKLDSARIETIQTRLIQWNQVSAFLWDYLGQRHKRDLFSRDEIYAGLWRFSTLVGEREITALLARLYAQHMIDFKEQPSAEHPHSIPELMDAYINELCRKADNKQYKRYEIHQIARIAAWECLRTTYTPVEAPLENVEQALAALPDSGNPRPYQRDPRAAINFFVDDLHLLQKFGMDGSRLKFSLDPPSEYLAARHLVVTLYRDDVARWDAFCADAAARPNAPHSIAGFLIALRDTWEAFGAEGEVKEHVLGKMHRLFGDVLGDAAPTQASQGVSLWISLLESSRKEDCLLALEELEKSGEAARDALPTLKRTAAHPDPEVQHRSAALLERLSAAAHAA